MRPIRQLLLPTLLSLTPAVPAQSVIISEFMAKNGATLADEDGDFSDWIEVHAPGKQFVDLAGWYLTDDPTDLTKWQFPTTLIEGGQHVVVFASDKDRSVAGNELHTNFKLSGDGEFLALVEPDGSTLATSFAPAYPPQRTDYSYGLAPSGTVNKLVDSQATCTALVPTSGALGLLWTSAGSFPGWASGATGVGYEQSPPGYNSLINLDVGASMYNVNGSTYIRIPFLVQDPSQIAGLTLRMKYDDGFVAYINGQEVARANAPAQTSWNSLATQSHADVEAVVFEDFALNNRIGALQAGENILAIHGLNSGLTSSDFLILPELVAPASYSANLAYMQPASPSGLPTTQGVAGFASDVQIQAPSGFYSAPTQVSMTTATAGATIRYTRDGSEPTLANGAAYSGPLVIDTTACLRAAAFQPGLGQSNVTTASYIYPNDVLRQPANPAGWPTSWGSAPAADYEMDPEIVNAAAYQGEVLQGLLDLPALSIVMDPNDLFGSQGIYQNPQSSGSAWERKVSAELLYFDGTPGFEIDCGLRVQGGASRSPSNSPKHSFSLRFRDTYGAGRLEHPVYPGSPVTNFDSLHIRHQWGQSFVHWCGTECCASTSYCGPSCAWAGGREKGALLREFWGKELMRTMGAADDAGRGLQVNLYLNGLYWGVYNLHERQDAAHYASWHGGNEDDYDAISGGSFANGNATSWNRLKSIVSSGDWASIQEALDVDNFIDFIIFTRYVGNTDIATSNNWRAAGGGPNNAPWRMYQWDIDHILEDVNVTNPVPAVDPTGLLAGLNSVVEFNMRFQDRAQKHFFNDGALTPAKASAMWLKLAKEVEFAITAESARWGDYRRDVHPWRYGPYPLYTKYDHVLPHQAWLMETYFPQRTNIVIQQYRMNGGVSPRAAPSFSQHGGTVPAGFQLVITAPAGTIYYTTDGSDPRLEGGAVSPTAAEYSGPITLNGTTQVKARALVANRFSPLNEAVFVVESIVLNELLASNTLGIVDEFGEHEDWIELYNKGLTPAVASGMYLTDNPANPTKWQIPAGQTINPGGTLLIWADEDGSQGPLHANFKLSASGEQVWLYDTDGQTLLSTIAFGPQVANVSTGWMTDGGGPLLVTFLDPSPRSPNEIQVCGARRYSAQDPTSQPITLSLIGTPGLGQVVNLTMFGGQPNAGHALFAALAPAELALPFSTSNQLISSLGLIAPIVAGPTGTAQFALPVPPLPPLVGVSLFFQDWTLVNSNIVASSGLEIMFCP